MIAKAVFLDRDGVINRALVKDGRPYPPRDLQGVEIIPGVHTALQKLKSHGFILIVVTNQPDVGRGVTPITLVEAINKYLGRELPIDKFLVCYHDDADNCLCRKPKPGMLFEAARAFDIDLNQSYLIGDRWRDVEAGINAGCKTIFIDYGYNEKQPENADFVVKSIDEVVEIILKGVHDEEN